MNRSPTRSASPHAAQIERLLAACSEETRLLKEVVQAVSDLRVQIVKNEIGSIEQRVGEHQRLLATIAQHGADRVRALQELAVRFDLKSDDTTVRGLAKTVGGELGQRLNSAADDLQRLGSDVARINRQNAALIVQSADLTREVIQVLTHSDPGGNSYDAGGDRQDAVGRSMIELDG